MKKLDFKIAYSVYRKKVSAAHNLGLDGFRNAINSSEFFKGIYLRDSLPVSVRCKLALSDAGLCKF